MTRNYANPAQQSTRGRSHTHSRTTSQQSQDGSSSGSSSDARDALAIVPHQQSRETRPRLDTNNTGGGRRDLDMSRPRQVSCDAQASHPRHDTTDARRDRGMSQTQQQSRPRRDTNFTSRDREIGRTRQESRSYHDSILTASGRLRADFDEEEIIDLRPRMTQRGDCHEGHRDTRRQYTRREGDTILAPRNIDASRQAHRDHLERTIEETTQEIARETRREYMRRADLTVTTRSIEARRYDYRAHLERVVEVATQDLAQLGLDDGREARRVNPRFEREDAEE